ncbi:MAG TPA: cyclase family protein [Candidatus Acidoferrum sp.]
MAALGRSSFLLVCFAAISTLLLQNMHNHSRMEGIPSGKTRVLDLSYAISDKLVPWPEDVKFFEAKVNASVEKNGYFTRSFWMLEHYGTHLDAPAHFPPGKSTVDQIPVKQLFGPAVVMDVRTESGKDADYQLSAARIEEWEKRHGRIPEGSVVLLRTGWASRWPDARKYRNQDAQGKMHFPGFSAEAAKLLIERGASGLGCDTLSVDYGASSDYSVHHLALGAGLYHLENLADLSELPETGAFLVVAPIKLEGGSGGPVRVFAILP